MKAGTPDSTRPAVSRDDRFAIVVSRFNADVTERLLEGALAALAEHGAQADHITTVWVPGAFEIPLAADRLARSGTCAAVICLGAVIQGETLHHEYINQQVAAAIMRIGLETRVPVTFGVLTCHTHQQALDRAGGPAGNKGREAALAALEMVGVLRGLQQAFTPSAAGRAASAARPGAEGRAAGAASP